MWLLYWNLGGLILFIRVTSIFLEKSFPRAERNPGHFVTAPGYSTITCTPGAPGSAAVCRNLALGLLVKCEACLSLLGNRLEQEEPLQNPELYILKIFLITFFPYILFPRKESGLFVGQTGDVKTEFLGITVWKYWMYSVTINPQRLFCLFWRQNNGRTLFLASSEFFGNLIFCP